MSGSKIIPMAVHYLSWHHSFLALTSSRSTADPTLQQLSFTRWRASCTQAYIPTYFWDPPTADHSLPEACSHFPKHEQLSSQQVESHSFRGMCQIPVHVLLDVCLQDLRGHTSKPRSLWQRDSLPCLWAPVCGKVPGGRRGRQQLSPERFLHNPPTLLF